MNKPKTLQVRVTPDVQQRIQDLIQIGEFESESQFLRTAIRYYFREREVVKV